MSLHAMNRRTFLETATTVTAATLLTRRFGWASDEHKIDRVGVQLYTVRDQMKDDFEGTIAKVAQIGYKEVEFAGYFDHTPQQVRAILQKNGLTSPACHVEYGVLAPDKWPEQLESAKVIGQPYIVNPWIPEELRKTDDDWKRAADTFNRAGEESKKAGIQFAYHNHWFEFLPVNGKRPYDLLLKLCDKNLVKMELDLCWITVGGGDPLKYFSEYPGRFPLVHVKDMKKLPKVSEAGGQDFGDSLKDMTSVGDGIIDWKRIFAKSEEAGIKHYIVEHDKPADPLASITASYEYLSKLRW
ncbi:MAG TPA: sugar phosphate isomerase/epimerase [Verrucomicrobiae bacterium]|nr:sugar phosphate isomerase/epimerase [Verrucomicrobiae bacterium]